jgi:hypothetical protein
MVLAFPTLASRFFTFSFLSNRQDVTDRATRRGAGQGVMVGEVASNAADHRAADATGLGLTGDQRLAGDQGGREGADQDL